MEQLPLVPVSTIDIDHLLKLQLVVAWAGEAETDPSRLGWWRTSMTDEYGGEDLLRRLTLKPGGGQRWKLRVQLPRKSMHSDAPKGMISTG